MAPGTDIPNICVDSDLIISIFTRRYRFGSNQVIDYWRNVEIKDSTHSAIKLLIKLSSSNIQGITIKGVICCMINTIIKLLHNK